MMKVDLSVVDENFLNEYLKAIDIESIKTKLKALNYDFLNDVINNFDDIIKADIYDIEDKYALYITEHIDNKKREEIKDIFDYSGYRKKSEFMSFFKKLNIKSCPFCNNNYIYFFKNDASKKYNTLATLEHYYPKAKYPHLSLSFYNLIPCCSICNSKFKGSDKKHMGKICHPYKDDFNEKAKFSVKLKKLDKDLKLDIDIKAYDKNAETSIDRFKLNEIYKQHDDIAKEIWNKAQYYNESRIEELYKEFYKNLGYTKEDVKNMVFCNYLNKDDINKRNHSKLTQDILKQFDLGLT